MSLLGQVPEAAPRVPLAQDLERLQRSLRLKPSPAESTLVLDLRRESQRERSVLLHRLRLLGVPWGTPADAGRTTGTFKEGWTLRWRPEPGRRPRRGRDARHDGARRRHRAGGRAGAGGLGPGGAGRAGRAVLRGRACPRRWPR
ncbi:hypothetical protein GCM10025868_14930 [Angustibacter aerolatus]|uniref:Uncharacterized protein n=1 Tax=Angustibacter aerolatus TaxID=1162965 RepID=A0ABQ6JDI4_9ACTN|nr:DUF5682 family protein [Angustibacter aerolatus]GMA86243.1 hypothetical protein GCM10025868_14930 [Angustibacter aerolatus]